MVRCALIPILAVVSAGCFYPPRERPLPDARSHLILHSPYYKVWDAVHDVLEHGDYRIINENPDEGIIEAQAAGGFTLADADCGKLRAVAGKYNAEPDLIATALYDFQIKPRGNESASVSVQGTFTTPVHVPLHPVRGGQCVSNGTQEARLLSAIAQRIHEDSTPATKPALVPPRARETVE
jgi:hypothetical protein